MNKLFKYLALSLLSIATSLNFNCAALKPVTFKPDNKRLEYKVDKYYTYEEYVDRMKGLEASNPNIVDLVSLSPKTWQGRTIYALKISDKDYVRDDAIEDSFFYKFKKQYYKYKKPKKKELKEPQVLFFGNMHARETISANIAYGIAKYLVENYDKNEKIKSLVDNREIYIIPVLNPDGVNKFINEINKDGYSYWRKNCRDINGDGKIDREYYLLDNGETIYDLMGVDLEGRDYTYTGDGVDLNRNFSFHWGGEGASVYGFSDIYAGPFDDKDDDGDWNPETDDLNGNNKPDIDFDGPRNNSFDYEKGDYYSLNSSGRYDPEPHVNEDPVDLIDNDGDGLIDEDPAGGFSEPETIAFKNLVDSLDYLVASISFHSCGNLIMYPPGYSDIEIKDEALFKKIAEGMRDEQVYDKYKVQPSYKLYKAAGDSEDWLYFKKGVLAFIVEVGKCNDSASNTMEYFNPPVEGIKKTVDNNVPMAVYLIEIADNPEKVLRK